MTPERYIVFDTETTGVESDKRACDIGMIEIDPVTLQELARCESLINPGIPIPAEAMAIHGITDEMVKDAPSIEEWVDAAFGPGGLDGKVALIGHRVDFDLPLFAPIGKAEWTVDTLLLTQLFLKMETKDRKLDTLKEALALPGGGESHRAMADCCTCLQLLQHLIPLSGRDLESIATTEIFMLHFCPWGKHENKPLMKVPRAYRDWMLSLDGLDRHLRYSLEMVAKTDFPLAPKRTPGSRVPPVKRRKIVIPPRRFK